MVRFVAVKRRKTKAYNEYEKYLRDAIDCCEEESQYDMRKLKTISYILF